MHSDKSSAKDLYYTNDHEWINFQGTVAYIGVSKFKLSGFREIDQINFDLSTGFKKRGQVIATLRYKDYQIKAHMPVDGKLIEINDALISGNPNVLLQYAENCGWLALIVPSQPYERKDLLLAKQYRLIDKDKYAK